MWSLDGFEPQLGSGVGCLTSVGLSCPHVKIRIVSPPPRWLAGKVMTEVRGTERSCKEEFSDASSKIQRAAQALSRGRVFFHKSSR